VSVPEVGVLDFLVEHGKWRDKSMAAKPAIIDTASGETLRYGELEARIHGCAHALHALGFRQGDVLAVHLHNCTEFIVAFLAVASLGGLTSPSNPAYVAEELARQIQDSGAKLLLSSTRYSKAVHGAMAELQAHDARGSQALALTRVAFIEDADCFARAPSHAAPVPLVRPIDARRDVAVLPYSSGTTGRPKGVQLSHHNLVANVLQLNADPFARLAFDERDTLLGLLPLYHIYGMTVLMLGALAHRATLVLLPKFEPVTFFGAIEKHRVSVACLVPPLCLFLAKDPSVARADLSSLKYIYSGAAPLDAALELAVVERLGGRVRVRQVRVRHDGALAHRALADCP
jgi:acyl-CoA synthetase (AMP-forming)/AMP-acid ligase II